MGKAKLCVTTTTNDFSRKQGTELERSLKITTATTEAKRTAIAKDYVVRSPQRAGVTNRNIIKVLTVLWSHRGLLTPACAVRLTSYSTLAAFAGFAFLVISHKSTARQPAVLG